MHFSARARKIKEIHTRKISHILGNGNPKKLLVISRKNAFLIFQEMETLKKSLIFQETETPKKLLIFQEVKSNFLASGLKKLSKIQNQTRSYSLELLAYYCIDYSLGVRLLTTHPVIHI